MQDYMNKMAVFINDGVQFIRNGDFKISPLSINPGRNVSQSCQYCSHQGICYMANTAPNADISIDAEGDE
jgi:ATP-dependent helicase/DNAse subunit B